MRFKAKVRIEKFAEFDIVGEYENVDAAKAAAVSALPLAEGERATYWAILPLPAAPA